MRSKVTDQIVDHATAIAKWVLDYVERYHIDIQNDSTWAKLDFHLSRLESLLDQIGYPLLRNPILSDAILQGKTPDKDYTEPLIE